MRNTSTPAEPTAPAVLAALTALLAALLPPAASPAAAATYSNLVVFGDSLSDTGNVYDRYDYPPPPYFAGRFSNGPLWVEALATALNVPAPMPNRTGGTNYAWGGANTGPGTGIFGVPNLGPQIDAYLGDATPAASDLLVLWGGANDFLGGRRDADEAVLHVDNHIRTLAAAGGTNFLVANLPPLGQLPETRGTADEAPLDALAANFNQQLAATLSDLAATLDLTIFQLDVHTWTLEVLADPAAFGFTNVRDAATDGSSVVPNPDEYLFWDTIHPTRAAHAILGQRAAATVPEPASAVAVLLLAFARRRRVR